MRAPAFTNPAAALTPRATLVLLIALCCIAGCARDRRSEAESAEPTTSVRRGPLRIVVREGGTLETPNAEIIKNLVYGKRPIIDLVPEGTYVSKGQVVCRLESQDMLDAEVKYQRRAEAARSRLKQAQGRYAIREKRNQEWLERAQRTLALARRARDGFETGTTPMERLRLTSVLTIARAEHERADETLAATKRLFAQDILPRSRLQADELGARKARERATIAEQSLAHFEESIRPDQEKKLQTAVELAEIALERMEQECTSELAKAKDHVDTRTRNLDKELEILRKVQRHIVNCDIRSPADGILIYVRHRRWGRDVPISEGKWTRQSEPLLLIPDFDTITVELDVHESQVESITEGLSVTVKVDAFQGETIPGKVAYVSPVPSSTSSWQNPDYRVYDVDIALDHIIEGLRPGMHAEVDILISDTDDTLQLPLDCIVPSGGRSFVYVPTPNGPELREITLGPNNTDAVEIRSGLEEGDRVYLSRPGGAPDVPAPDASPFLPATQPTDNG